MAEQLVLAEVKSPWYSKINWTQAVGLVASIAAVYSINVSPEMQAAIVIAIQAAQSLLTVVFRTYFNETVSPPASTP